jgi:phosphatidylglycerophosphatase A
MGSAEHRKIHWENIRTPRAWLALAIGTAGGAGFGPLAPGTWGTLVAVPLVWWLAECPWEWRAAFWIALTVAGTWAAKVFDELMSTGDHQSIVIDEVIGYGITAWTAARDPWLLGVAFVLFRILDMAKPPPIRYIDGWSKRETSSDHPDPQRATWRGGFSVLADDIAAGLLGLALILLLQRFKLLPG